VFRDVEGDEVAPAPGLITVFVKELHRAGKRWLQRRFVCFEQEHDQAPADNRNVGEGRSIWDVVGLLRGLSDALKDARKQVEAQLLVYRVLFAPHKVCADDACDE